MEIDRIGEVYIDGRLLNLDNLSTKEYEEILSNIGKKKEEVIKGINRLLAEI